MYLDYLICYWWLAGVRKKAKANKESKESIQRQFFKTRVNQTTTTDNFHIKSNDLQSLIVAKDDIANQQQIKEVVEVEDKIKADVETPTIQENKELKNQHSVCLQHIVSFNSLDVE